MTHNEEFGLSCGQDLALVPGYAYGLRTWSFRRDSPELRGSYGREWHAGINDAECGKSSSVPRHARVPDRECSCGYYGYWSSRKDRLVEEAEQASCVCSSCIKIYKVAGVIRISGRVIIGTAGFRAEKAEIMALSLSPSLSELSVRIRQYAAYVGMEEKILRTVWGIATPESELDCCSYDEAKKWLGSTFNVPVMDSINDMLLEYPADPPQG